MYTEDYLAKIYEGAKELPKGIGVPPNLSLGISDEAVTFLERQGAAKYSGYHKGTTSCIPETPDFVIESASIPLPGVTLTAQRDSRNPTPEESARHAKGDVRWSRD